MAAILLQDQEAHRLVAKVNAMTTHVPVGGLVYANASFCQLMIDGDPGGITYDIIIDQEADSYAAKAQAQPGQALGNILFVNGFFVQAFGAAAGGSGGVAWADITDKPAVIAAGATQAAARTAIGAGTSSLAIGTTATTAKAGNYVPTWTEVSGKPAVIAAGADAAAARTAIGAGTPYSLPNASPTVRGGVLVASVQANSAAADVAALVADFNALLAKLKTAGIMASV